MKQKADLMELLKNIKTNPKDYLGRKSVILLYIFLLGYKEGLNTLEITMDTPFKEFQQWIANKYKGTFSISWADYILLYSEDEVEAFYKFYELFEEFLTNTVIQSNIKQNQIKNKPFNLYRILYEIQLCPAMYIGTDKNFELLKVYIDGILKARREFNAPITVEEQEYYKFPQWLFNKRHYYIKTPFAWEKMFRISGIAGSSDNTYMFFRDYNEYLQKEYEKSICGY